MMALLPICTDDGRRRRRRPACSPARASQALGPWALPLSRGQRRAHSRAACVQCLFFCAMRCDDPAGNADTHTQTRERREAQGRQGKETRARCAFARPRPADWQASSHSNHDARSTDAVTPATRTRTRPRTRPRPHNTLTRSTPNAHTLTPTVVRLPATRSRSSRRSSS